MTFGEPSESVLRLEHRLWSNENQPSKSFTAEPMAEAMAFREAGVEGLWCLMNPVEIAQTVQDRLRFEQDVVISQQVARIGASWFQPLKA